MFINVRIQRMTWSPSIISKQHLSMLWAYCKLRSVLSENAPQPSVQGQQTNDNIEHGSQWGMYRDRIRFEQLRSHRKSGSSISSHLSDVRYDTSLALISIKGYWPYLRLRRSVFGFIDCSWWTASIYASIEPCQICIDHILHICNDHSCITSSRFSGLLTRVYTIVVKRSRRSRWI